MVACILMVSALAGLPPVRTSTRPISPPRQVLASLVNPVFATAPTAEERAAARELLNPPTEPVTTTADVMEVQTGQEGTAKKKKKVKAKVTQPPPPRPIKVEQSTEVGPSLAGSHTTSDGETFPQTAGSAATISAAATAEAPVAIELHAGPVDQAAPESRQPLAAIGDGLQRPVVKQEKGTGDASVSQPRRRRDPNAPKPPPSAPPVEVIELTSSSSEDDQ